MDRRSVAIDITEIEGFDNLHDAQGVILEAEKRAADFAGAQESFFLVNGSTAGILSAVSACTARGGKNSDGEKQPISQRITAYFKRPEGGVSVSADH